MQDIDALTQLGIADVTDEPLQYIRIPNVETTDPAKAGFIICFDI